MHSKNPKIKTTKTPNEQRNRASKNTERINQMQVAFPPVNNIPRGETELDFDATNILRDAHILTPPPKYKAFSIWPSADCDLVARG